VPLVKERDEQILQVLERIACEIETSNHLKHKIMTALDTLTSAIGAATQSATALTAAVDTAVTEITTPAATDTQLLSLSSVVVALQGAIDAQTKRLVTATTPPAITPPPTP